MKTIKATEKIWTNRNKRKEKKINCKMHGSTIHFRIVFARARTTKQKKSTLHAQYRTGQNYLIFFSVFRFLHSRPYQLDASTVDNWSNGIMEKGNFRCVASTYTNEKRQERYGRGCCCVYAGLMFILLVLVCVCSVKIVLLLNSHDFRLSLFFHKCYYVNDIHIVWRR